MKITHRAPADNPALPTTAAAPVLTPPSVPASFDKAPRFSCCCRLSELLPKVRQVHDAVRAARLATEAAPAEAA